MVVSTALSFHIKHFWFFDQFECEVAGAVAQAQLSPLLSRWSWIYKDSPFTSLCLVLHLEQPECKIHADLCGHWARNQRGHGDVDDYYLHSREILEPLAKSRLSYTNIPLGYEKWPDESLCKLVQALSSSFFKGIKNEGYPVPSIIAVSCSQMR
jgi:hypothetical protein